MLNSKLRNSKIPKTTEDLYYLLVLKLILERTAVDKTNEETTLKKWCRFTKTDFEIINRSLLKLSYTTQSMSKKVQMRALSYFGVTIAEIKDVFGITACYATSKKAKDNVVFQICTDEEMFEVRNLIDRLIYLLWLFKYIKYDENGLVVKEEHNYSRGFVAEMYMRTAVFYYKKRYKTLFPNEIEVNPVMPLSHLIGVDAWVVNYTLTLLHSYNIYINKGDVRSLLYYALDIQMCDTDELLKYKQPALHYRKVIRNGRPYSAILNEQDHIRVEKFLKATYDMTKYICCLKGVLNKDE